MNLKELIQDPDVKGFILILLNIGILAGVGARNPFIAGGMASGVVLFMLLS